MPLWGGIAIFTGFAITCLAIREFAGAAIQPQIPIVGVLVAGAVIVTIGLLDDVKELSAGTQAFAIICAAAMLALFNIKIQFISNPFGHPPMFALNDFMSFIITIIWVFGVTKTVDFMDGLDGLAAGIGAIAAGFLAIMAYYSAQPHVAVMAAALSGACLGFLRFNFNPAKIFMGTGGSQFIGFALAAISIIGAFKVAAALAIALPILVFGVPIFDAVFVIFRRFVDRKPLHEADQSHLHHRLLAKGLTHKQAVLIIYLICLILGGVALALFWLMR
jgi:UDP-GlcNAc:undecaprenyl-phosphate GlcNAc-1-phosphate transferase